MKSASDKHPPIYTIGYGSRSIDEFLELLLKQNINYLIDVRTKPYSRFKPEFTKSHLEKRLFQEGIRYVFMGDTLGGMPDDPSVFTDGKVDYKKVEALPSYQEGVSRLQTAFEKRLRVVLMCSEGKPEMCHRSKLIGQTVTALGIPMAHLDECGETKTQEEILLRLTGGKTFLFTDDLTFTSRQAYRSANEEKEEA